METTPSSTRRITRSQTRVAATKNNSITSSTGQTEEPDKSTLISEQMSAKKKQQQDRTALIDITNDSPIVGVAMGNLETPSSKKRVMNSRVRHLCTPGSGEALLRGQVETLLQKVDEEAVLQKITLDTRPFFNLQGLVNSPINLLAPTPANTPQVLNFSDANDCVLPCVTQEILIPEIAFDQKTSQETSESSENGITRSLLLDFSDSSDCSSALTYEGIAFTGESGSSSEKAHRDEEDDDDSSVWSIQANASSTRDDDYEVVEEEYYDGEEEEYYVNEDEEEEDYDHDKNADGLHLDELCEGLSKVIVCGDAVAKFTGKRIRFVYNSDDELQGQEEVGCMRNSERFV